MRTITVTETELLLVLLAASLASAVNAASCPQTRVRPHIPAEIVLLHRQDIAATLNGSTKALSQLWTDDAVRMEPGGPAEVGKAAITGNDQKSETNRARGAAVLAYQPQICDVTVIGTRAVEWGYFRYVYRKRAGVAPEQVHGKLLRVLRQGKDGLWKFSHVIWNAE